MMTEAKILDVFYQRLVKEASSGKVNCYFTMNIAFNLVVDNIVLSKSANLPCEGLLIPTLKVTNKDLFDNLLTLYVKKALATYDPKDFAFLNDCVEEAGVKEEYLIKYVICTLLANASFTDFENPIKFLQSRINMFDKRILKSEEPNMLGYLDSIGAKIYVEESLSPIRCETPYHLKSYLEFDDGNCLNLPLIYAGNDGEKYMLYAIQKDRKTESLEEKKYLKKIREGVVSKIKGAPEHYFLAVMFFLAFCKNQEIEVIPFLVARWNAKKIAINERAKVNSNMSLIEMEHEQELIQNNITDIFLRYFTKIQSVSKGIDFSLVPFDVNSNLVINMSSDFASQSILFNEIFSLANNYKNDLKR